MPQSQMASGSSPTERPALPVTAMVPVSPYATSYSRFITTFEVAEFTNWIDESVSWKTTCYIGDWSPVLKLRIQGPEARAFLEHLSTNCWPNFKQYTAKHSIMCRGDGKVVGEGLVMKLDEDDYIYTSGPGVDWANFQFQYGPRKFNCTTSIVTNDWYLFQIQGPQSIRVIEAATRSTITDLKFLYAKQMSIDGMKVLALRQGVSGERGYELWGPAKDGQAVYKAILQAGEAFGIRQLGMRTKLVNHAEAAVPTPVIDFLPAIYGDDPEIVKYRDYLKETGDLDLSSLPIYGNYTSDPAAHQRSPFDLGWDRILNFDHDFIGKQALQAIASDPPHKFVTLEWNSEDVVDVFASLFREESYDYMEMPRYSAMNGNSVYVNGSKVGCAMSRCYSYSFKKMLSHCIIDTKHSTVGSEVSIKWGDGRGPEKMIRAIVSKTPYKDDQRKKAISSMESDFIPSYGK